jgi:hypothetical protein
LAPGRYYLVKESCSAVDPTGLDLPTPSATGTISMAATAGKVALVNNQTALSSVGCPTSGVIDFVGYGTTANCREGTTTADNAPAPSSTTADIRKNGGNQDTDINAADFVATAPFPRSGVATASSPIAPDSFSRGCQFFDLLTGPTLSWSHTIGSGSNRILIVGVSTDTVDSASPVPVGVAVPAPRVATVTYNGQLLTRIDDSATRDVTNRTQVEMFRLGEASMPAAGTYTISVTLTLPVNVSTYVVGGGASFFGVDQTTPTNTYTKATGNSNAPTVASVPSGTNEYVIDTVSSIYTGSGAALLTVNNPLQTERWNGGKAIGGGSNCFASLDSIGAGSTRPGASPSVPMQWSLNSPEPWAIGAVSLRPASTLVELASFEAAKVDSGVVLKWRTGYEVNNLGFNLYREQKGKRTRVNPSIIAGSALLIGQGSALTAGDSYTWFDPQGTADTVYYLEDVDLSGARKLNGPVQPIASSSASLNAGQALLLNQVNAQAATAASGISKWQKEWPAPSETVRELLYDMDARPGTDAASLIAAHGAVKLSVNEAGWYRVTQADLSAAGFNQPVDAHLLQLYVGGSQIPIQMHASGKQFSPGDSFEFYGTGLDTPTTDTNTYWLVVGNGKGLRLGSATRTSTSAKTDSSAASRASTTQSQTGTVERQGAQATPSNASTEKTKAILRLTFLDRFILPILVPSAPEESVVKPKSDDDTGSSNSSNSGAREAAPSSTVIPPTVTSTTTAAKPPAKKSKKAKRKKARTGKARRKAASLSHASLRPAAVESYPYTVELKERLIYISSLLNGETENFYGKVVGGSPVVQQLFLRNVSQAGDGTTEVEVALQGYTLGSHQVRVKLNGGEVGSISFKGQEHAVAKLTAPSSLLVEGQNTVTLERTGGETDVSLVDWTRLTYAHNLRADDNLVRFSAEGRTRLDGFTSGRIRAFDVTDPQRARELNTAVESTTQGYAVTLNSSSEGQYLALTEDQIKRPFSIELDKPSSLKTTTSGADLIIITHGDFVGSVQPLAEQRRNQGLAVSVVDVQDVYDEFGYGAHSPYAVRDFLAWTKTHWQNAPKFVLLVGDASLDPRNYQGQGATDLVPTKLIDASTMETASDDWLADFNKDGVAEMAMGRLPVRTKAEADQVIAKIVGYTPASALQQVTIVTDKNNAGDTFSFEQLGQELGASLPASVSVNPIKRSSGSDDAVHTQIVNAINQGPLFVNYIGHGSVEVWTGGSILSTTDTTAALNNNNRLPVFVMMTCLNGYFPNSARDSLAEALMRNNASGAVAVWASSGMTEPNAQSQLNKQFYQFAFGTDAVTLGEAVQKSKEGVDNGDVRRTWILFGDPTMRIR